MIEVFRDALIKLTNQLVSVRCVIHDYTSIDKYPDFLLVAAVPIDDRDAFRRQGSVKVFIVKLLQIVVPAGEDSLKLVCVQYHGKLKCMIYGHYDLSPLQTFLEESHK